MAYFPTITSLLILQWHTGVCEETFGVNSKIAQTTQCKLKVPVFENISFVRKSILQEIANHGDYPGDFRL